MNPKLAYAAGTRVMIGRMAKAKRVDTLRRKM